MIQIIIILAIMQMGFNLLFKPKYNQLACGLFGAAADDVNKININKLKILGMYNDSRGGHSCGMSIDGDIILGTYKNKLFKDFISEVNISAPQTLPVVLGHTRMATGGTHNEDNAHPFGYGSNGDYYDFIGTHNGTLHNEDELAKEYGISTSITSYKDGKSSMRHKIDSEILLEIIYEKGFTVLEKYNGAAALAMYDTKKPNVLYLYHGASPKTEHSKELIEERPLYYYQESENVVYYSSLKNSLEAINDTDGEIGEFKHNIVYKIENGNVSTAKQRVIDRSKCIQSNTSCSYSYQSIDYSKKEWNFVKKIWEDKVEKPAVNTIDILFYNWRKYLSEDKHIKGKTYYENLRFYIDKQLLHGIYVLNKKQELVRLCSYFTAIDTMWELLNKENDSLFDEIIPLYFIEGIRVETSKDYQLLQDNFKKFTTVQLSHCSVYPIRDVKIENALCYHKGSVATTTFKTIATKDIIKIVNGKYTEIKEVGDIVDKNLYYIEDLAFFEKLSPKKELMVVEEEKKDENQGVIDLYKENILATVEYCLDDCDDSFDDPYVQNQIKSRLGQITKFVTKLLTI